MKMGGGWFRRQWRNTSVCWTQRTVAVCVNQVILMFTRTVCYHKDVYFEIVALLLLLLL